MTRYYPIELDVENQPILMVGGGQIAARKLPELLACGALITLIAPMIDPALQHLISAIHWENRLFREDDIHDFRLVFACTPDVNINTQISTICQSKGIPCNRADKALQGSFIVPGVVRRKALTLSISTSSEVPVLTRHLKRKLSGLFGNEWGELVTLLSEIRVQGVSGSENSPPPSKGAQGLSHQDWGRISMDTLAEILRTDGFEAARQHLHRMVTPTALPNALGRQLPLPPIHPIFPVLLVGAGPGDRSLLTMGAAEAIEKADVILHDRLVAPDILQLASKNSWLVPAEKRGHFASSRQEHINAQMIEYAQTGKHVVRLKGGDPFIFGRGFEEALALEKAGIPWRILPGVSSSTAIPALAGIPLTHRGVARNFAVVSGMTDAGTHLTFPKVDTLVLLMSLFRLEEVIPALLSSGYAPQTPAAAIQNGGRPEQRICRTTLEKLGEETAKQGFDSPTLVVVGQVVALHA